PLLLRLVAAADEDLRADARLAVLQRVADQGRQQLHHPLGGALRAGQALLDADRRALAAGPVARVAQHRLQAPTPGERPRGVDDLAGAAEGQQVVDEPAEPAAGLA